MKTRLQLLAVGVALAVFGGMAILFLAFLGIVLPLQLVVALATGWLKFLFRVLPQVEVDVGAVALGCGAFGIFVVGLHVLMRHLSASYDRDDLAATTSLPASRRWRFRWTISAASIILLMFTAGIAFVGITHQTIWLLTSPEPVVHTRGRLIAPKKLRVQFTPASGETSHER